MCIPLSFSFCFGSLSRSPSLCPYPVSSYPFLSGGLWPSLPSEIIDRDFKSPHTYPLPQNNWTRICGAEIHTLISPKLPQVQLYLGALLYPFTSTADLSLWHSSFPLLHLPCRWTCCPETFLHSPALPLPSGLWLLDIYGAWFYFHFVFPWHCALSTTLSFPFHFPVCFLLLHWYFCISEPVVLFSSTIYCYLFLLSLLLFPLINVHHMLIPSKLTSLTYLPPSFFHLTG